MSEAKKVQSAHLTYHERKKFHEERLEQMKIVAEYMDDDKLVEIADKIDKANNVFVVALGRSRMNIMAFATRLRQMRIRTHVVGDISTPSIHKGDLLIIGSSSGETSSLVTFAKKAQSFGVEVVLFTESKKSTIGDIASTVYLVEADQSRLPKPLGLYAEYAVDLAYNCIVMYLMKKRGLTPEKMQEELANLY